MNPGNDELADLSPPLRETLQLCCMYLVALDEQFTDVEQQWVDTKFGTGTGDQFIEWMPSMDWENCFSNIHNLLGTLNEIDRAYMTNQAPALFQQLMEADGITGVEQERLGHLMQFIRESISTTTPNSN